MATTTSTPLAQSSCADSIAPTRRGGPPGVLWSWSPGRRSAASSRPGPPSSHAGDGLQLPAVDRRPELLVVGLVLIGVRLGELAHRALEGVALAEIRGDRHPVTRPRMGTCQGPTAELRVLEHSLRGHRLDLRRALPVPELPDVVVVRLAVDALLDREPAEKDVARRLHQPLPLDDPPALLLERALPREALEHRRLGLLDLQEERVLGVPAEQEHDPGAGTDAAHADHLSRQVHVAIAVGQMADVPVERAAIGVQEIRDHPLDQLHLLSGPKLSDGNDDRRVADDPEIPIDRMGEPVEGPQAVLALRLRKGLVVLVGVLLADPGPELLEGLEVEALVPDVDRPHRREPAHLTPVFAGGARDGGAAIARLEAAVEPCDLEARGQALDVPLERAGMRLVEVVDVEDQAAVGRGEHAEVAEVRVPAELDGQIRARSGGEIAGHDPRRP